MKGRGNAPQERARFSNRLLDGLGEDEVEALRWRIEEREVRPGETLIRPGDAVDGVYFPCGRALLSLVVAFADGREVHALSVGSEGAAGGLTGTPLRAYVRVAVKAAGRVLRLPLEEVERARQLSPQFRDRFARYLDSLLAQAIQSLACNAVHGIEARAAKWILAALARTEGTTVALTQEELAAMLGVGRSYANRITQSLKAQGLIATRRAMIIVPDPAALEAKACGCGRWVRG
jgi:CRP-like cAMP-binding protein